MAVRRAAAGAAAGGECWDLLARMADDPDPGVRREVALALAGVARQPRAALETLDRLADDPEMPVRAAAYVARLLQGTPVPLPPGLDPRVAAGVVQSAAHLPALRETARTLARRRTAAWPPPWRWRCCRTMWPARWPGPTRCPPSVTA